MGAARPERHGAGAFAAANQPNCEGPVNGSQTTISGLEPGSQYAFGAYANAQCSQALAAGAQGAAFNTAQAQSQSSSVRLTAHSIASTSLTLNIHGHTAAWHYQATPYLNREALVETVACVSVAANTSVVKVSSLMAGTDYTIKAYSDSACTAANELTDDLADLDFSTPGVVLNASYLLVPEGDTYRHTVRLSSEPLASGNRTHHDVGRFRHNGGYKYDRPRKSDIADVHDDELEDAADRNAVGGAGYRHRSAGGQRRRLLRLRRDDRSPTPPPVPTYSTTG